MTVLLAADPGMGLVIGMGLGTVFVGLICIILICYLMGAILRAVQGKKPAPAPETTATPVPAAAPAPIENKGELIAVISAAIAEELGEDVEAIRIKSIRKVS